MSLFLYPRDLYFQSGFKLVSSRTTALSHISSSDKSTRKDFHGSELEITIPTGGIRLTLWPASKVNDSCPLYSQVNVPLLWLR